MWFYDGPHDPLSTANAVEYYSDCLAQEAVLIFDDANWEGVVDGAREGIQRIGAEIAYEKMLLNEEEDPEGWWNGLYVVVIQKAEEEIIEL